MPIVKKEFLALNKSLEQLATELKERFKVDLQYAEYRPKPASFFEHFVLYNSALATEPSGFHLNRLSRGDFRAVGFLPVPSVKSHRTVWRMADTLKPSITTQNHLQFNFWFDRALERKLRPDIIVRTGKFELKGEYSSHVQLLRNGETVAEYSDQPLEEKAGYLVEVQKGDWSTGRTHICFRCKEEYSHPPLVIECKSFGAKLGNPEEYAKYAKQVVIVSPEKLYQPKRENIHVVRVDNKFTNLTLRQNLLPYLRRLQEGHERDSR